MAFGVSPDHKKLYVANGLTHGVLQKLWFDRPLRTQVLVAIAAINFLAAIVAGLLSILNTRTATKVEMQASLEVADRLVEAKLSGLTNPDQIEKAKRELPEHLKHLRHVRLMFMDHTGRLTIASPHRIVEDGARPYVPRWFVCLGEAAGRRSRGPRRDGGPFDSRRHRWGAGGRDR